MTEEELELAALQYLRLGWSVIPMRRRDKRPAIPWQAFQSALTKEEEVRDWFHRWAGGQLEYRDPRDLRVSGAGRGSKAQW